MKTHTTITIGTSTRFDGFRVYGALLKMFAERSTGRLYTPETANDPPPPPVPVRLGERAYLHAQMTPEAVARGDGWEVDNCPLVLDTSLKPDDIVSTNLVPDHEERYTITFVFP